MSTSPILRGTLLGILLVAGPTREDLHYEDEDFEVVESLGVSLRLKCLTFILNQTGFDHVGQLKQLSERNLYSRVITRDRLEHLEYSVGCGEMAVTKERLDARLVIQRLPGVHLLAFAESLPGVEGSYIPASGNVFVARRVPRGVSVSRVYHLKRGEVLEVKSFGTWQRKTRRFVPDEDKRRRLDFKGLPMDMLLVHDERECDEMVGKHVLDRMECYHQDLMGDIACRLNFTIKRIDTPDKIFPYTYPNGSLASLFKMLHREEVDFSSGSYIINVGRFQYYAFVWPTFHTRSMMYIKLKNIKNNWRAFLRPLNNFLWKVIASWIFGTGLLIQVFEEFRTKSATFRFAFVPGLVKSIYSTLQVFCNQGLEDMPKWFSSRTVYLFSFVFSLIVFQVYSAILISSLMIVVPEVPFVSMTGLRKDGTYKVMTIKIGFHSYYVQKWSEQQKGKVGHILMDETELPLDGNAAIARLCTPKNLAFLEFRENIVQYHLPCKIMEIPRPMLSRNVGIGFPKNSTLQRIMNKELTVLRSAGIVQRMKKSLLSYVKLSQRETSSEEYMLVSVAHVVSIFFILGVGHAFSFAILLLEILLDAALRSRQSRASRLCNKREKLEAKHASSVKAVLGWVSMRAKRSTP